MWLLGAEGLTANKNNGSVKFQDNIYYDNWMQTIAGQRVIVRFDSADFMAGLHIYSHDNAYAPAPKAMWQARCGWRSAAIT